jgi:hypothetical protein
VRSVLPSKRRALARLASLEFGDTTRELVHERAACGLEAIASQRLRQCGGVGETHACQRR